MAPLLLFITTFAAPILAQTTQTTWYPDDIYTSAPPGWNGDCITNDDCGDTVNVCCSVTAALGKRQISHEFYPYVHYCLPYKTADAEWCDLRMQYSKDLPNYFGLCPCGPGLKCSPTEELEPFSYPRNRYGKCIPA